MRCGSAWPGGGRDNLGYHEEEAMAIIFWVGVLALAVVLAAYSPA